MEEETHDVDPFKDKANNQTKFQECLMISNQSSVRGNERCKTNRKTENESEPKIFVMRTIGPLVQREAANLSMDRRNQSQVRKV